MQEVAMKCIIAWFDELADDMRFFAGKVRSFRFRYSNIDQGVETKNLETEDDCDHFMQPLNIGSIEPYPLITPASSDEFVNVMSPFNGFNKTIL